MGRVYLVIIRLLHAERRGGHPPSKIRACGRLFLWIAAIATARIGWIEVGLLSVRIEGVSGVGIGRGKIVDCRGCLARFRLDEWGIVWGITSIRKKEGLDYII